jgi:hypothetical protein
LDGSMPAAGKGALRSATDKARKTAALLLPLRIHCV